jgi:uncharacterized protein YcbK (DUF882 family)
MNNGQTRRSFLIGSTIAGSTLLMSGTAIASQPKRLRFLNLHTGERADAEYRIGDTFQADALAAFDRLLRDHRTGEIYETDRTLFDALHRLAGVLETNQPFHVISGYRSPRTNAILANRSGGVARNSFHQWGMAIDLRVPGRSLDAVYRAARSLQAGGVGKYRRSNFVHVDTGRVRYWRQG